MSEGKRLPDGIVLDTKAGHIYWTNMGVPTANDGSIERAKGGSTCTPLRSSTSQTLPACSQPRHSAPAKS